MDPDFLLIQKMKNGGEDAIDTFVRRYYSKILSYCRLHVQDTYEAEDLTQETFVRFFQSLERYRSYGKVSSYLYTIAANACRDYHRKRKAIPLEDLHKASDEPIEELDAQLDIRHALLGLPQELQEPAILFFYQELKQKDIARILGMGLPLVKYRIRKARELLALELRGP